MKYFNTKTKFESDSYYTFENINTDIYFSETILASEKKYFSICGTGIRKPEPMHTAFYLKNLNNVTLDFGGAVITLHGLIQPFIIDSCSNITVKNVTVAYDRSNYTELDIVDHIGNELYCISKEKFPCRVENGYFIPYSNEWEDRNVHSSGCLFMQAYDKSTREGVGLSVIYLGEEIVEQPSAPVKNIPHIRVRSESDKIVFIGDIPQNWNSSHSIVLEHGGRDISSIAMYHSENITIENYRILNGSGMGLYSVTCKNIFVKGLRLINDSLSHGLIANSADGIHFVATKGKIEISDSIFEGIIDDALNIHSNYYYVNNTNGNIISAERSDKSHGLNANTDVFQNGDLIAVYNGDTLELKGKFTVSGRRIIDDQIVELIVDSEASGLIKGDLIENLSTNAEITITNSRFAKSNAHLRLQSRGKITVNNCEFTLPILLSGDTNYWYESSPVKDMTVENCTFKGERAIIRVIPEFKPTENEPFYHSGIKIINCCFDNETVISANYADNIIIKNTLAAGTIPKPKLKHCGTVEIIGKK